MKTKSDVLEVERKKWSNFDNKERQKKTVVCGGTNLECRFQCLAAALLWCIFPCPHTSFPFALNSGSYNVAAVLIKQTFLTTAPLIMLLLSTGVVNRIHSGETELV